MTVSKRRPLKLKGAVLIMVVTILFVFILMLMATLAVVSSTTRRTYTKYEENQAYYTARSVLEVYMKEFLEDDTDYQKSQKVDTVISAMEAQGIVLKVMDDAGNETSGADVFLNPAFTGAGFDKTKLESWKYIDFADKYISNGFIHQQELFGYLEPKYKFKPGNSKAGVADIKDDENWELNKSGGSTDKYYVEFETTVPDVSKTDSAKFDYDGKVKVRIELLRVLYVMKDGSTVNDTTKRTSSTFRLDDIDWTRTYYRIKVSTTANLGDGMTEDVNGYKIPENNSEITVSVLLEPATTIATSGFTNAMTSLKDTNAENKLFTIGGASANNRTGGGDGDDMKLGNNSAVSGNYLYNVPWLNFNTAPSVWYQPAGTRFIVQNGGIGFENDLTLEGEGNLNESNSDKLSKRPYLYAAGMEAGVHIKIGGSSSNACDLILTSQNHRLNDKNKVPTGLVCDDPNNIALVTSASTFEVYGDVYVDGDMVIDASSNNKHIYGDVYCTGKIYYINGTAATGVFEGDVKCQGIYDGSNVAIADTTALFNGGSLSIETVDMDLDWEAGTVDEKTNQVVFDLDKRGEIKLETVDTVKSEYVYQDGDKLPSGKSVGDLITADEMFKKDTDCETASLEVSSSAPKVNPKTMFNGAAIDFGGNSYSGNVLDPKAIGYYNNDTDMYEMKFDANDFMNYSGTVYINATEVKTHIQLTGSSGNIGNINFITVGDKSLIITIADNQNVYFPDTAFYSLQIKQMIDNGDIFYIGEDTKPENVDKPKAPNISYYIGKNSSLSVENKNNSIFCGYMYGPEATFKANTSLGKGIKFDYNDSGPKPASGTVPITFFGSIVFERIDTLNELGAFYVKPSDNGGGGNAGGNIKWSRTRYLNTQ